MNLDSSSIGPEQKYFAFLAHGRFMIQRSKSTGEYCFYPRIAIPGTGKDDLEWVQASGIGTVYATSVVRQRPEKGGVYNVALIDLKEGPRMMSRVEGCPPDKVNIGMKVEAEVISEGQLAHVIFRPFAEVSNG